MSEENKETTASKQTEQATDEKPRSETVQSAEATQAVRAEQAEGSQAADAGQAEEQATQKPQQPREPEQAKQAEKSDNSAQAERPADKPVAEKVEKPALSDEEKEARKKAREERLAKAKAAKEGAAGKAAEKAEGTEEAEEAPKPPSPHQPLLDKVVKLIQDEVSPEAIEEAEINELDDHLPTLVIKGDYWVKTARLLKDHQDLKLNYLINLSGVDRETHLEVVYHMESFETKEQYCVKVRTDRDAPAIPSVTPIWSTANWPEREVYDLLGIQFPGHPDLRRIMMPDDWVGHPLRKDYEPLDPEV